VPLLAIALTLVEIFLLSGCKRGTVEVVHGVRVVRILPRALDPGAPLVVALHGRSGDAQSFAFAWRSIDLEVAGPEGFIPLARGFSWFDWPGGLSEEQIAERAIAAADRLWPAIVELASGRKVIVIGASQGGILAFALAARYPEAVAYAFPIAAWAPGQMLLPGRIPAPILAFHGTEDRVIPIDRDRASIAAFREHGGLADLEEFPGDGHEFTRKVRNHVLGRVQSILAAAPARDAGPL
jgi:predicted esterase